jgi:hypothetical protein
MSKVTRTRFLSVVMAAILSVASAANAQTQDAPAEQPSSIQGELLAVDLEAKTIDVKVGEQTAQFWYTDATEVVGAQEGIAGLATVEGARVLVQFIEADGRRTATRIEVSQPADSPSQQ